MNLADLRRHLVAPVGVVLAVLVQATVVPRLPLPFGTPDLVVVVVAAFGMARGPESGLFVGLGAGFLADLVPPADHAIGRLALAYAAAGWLAGWLDRPDRPSPWFRLTIVAAASATAVAVYAGLGILTGDVRIGGGDVLRVLSAVAVDGVLLAMVVVPVVAAAVRWADRPPATVLQ